VRKEVVPIDTLQLLDELEEVIGAGWPVPGVGRAMVDVDRAMEMIESIRASLPQEVQEARQIVAERESLFDQARAEAERLVDEAQREAAELVRQEGVYKTAERQARAMLDQASARAEEIYARADEYAIESLRSLEARLTQTLDTVQNGIAALQARTHQQAPPEEDAHQQASPHE
jgi:vacuolar-type H+-ATPase subunit H